MNEVRLKNGTTALQVAVASTLSTLEVLRDNHPLALFDLVMFARDPGDTLDRDTLQMMKKFSLVDESGAMPRDVRNVVLSAAEGDGLNMRLVSPLA